MISTVWSRRPEVLAALILREAERQPTGGRHSASSRLGPPDPCGRMAASELDELGNSTEL